MQGAYNDNGTRFGANRKRKKEVGLMSCNNSLFGTNCCTWLIIILLLVLFNNEGIFGGCGNGCGCGNNCGNGCGC